MKGKPKIFLGRHCRHGRALCGEREVRRMCSAAVARGPSGLEETKEAR